MPKKEETQTQPKPKDQSEVMGQHEKSEEQKRMDDE